MNNLTPHAELGNGFNLPIKFTYFENRTTATGTLHELDWSEFCKWLESHKISENKELLPLIKVATFKNNHRKDANVEEIYAIEGDYDAGEMQPSEAADLLQAYGIAALIYTTSRHIHDAPRWRVVCPLSHPITPEQHADYVAKLNGVLVGVLGVESFTLSQAYHVGNVNAQFYHSKGVPIDAAQCLPPAISKTSNASSGKRNGSERAPNYQMALDALQSIDPSDLTRNEWLMVSGAFYTAALGLVEPGKTKADWLEWNRQYQQYSPETYNESSDERTWSGFSSSGTDGDFVTLAMMSNDVNAKGWALFKGVEHNIPVVQTERGGLFVTLDKLLQNRTARGWLIKDLIRPRTTGVLFAPPNMGKSFFAINIAFSIANGEPFNRKPVKKHGHVFYIAGEGFEGVSDRFEALYQETGLKTGANRIHISKRALSFVSGDDFSHIKQEIDTLPEPPVFIVIDTLFRATAGADVNENAAMTGFWNKADELKDRYGATVLVVHHTGRAETERSFGSVVLLANADFEMGISKDGDILKVKNTKEKDDAKRAPDAFKLRPVNLPPLRDADGEMEVRSSCVIEFLNELPPKLTPQAQKAWDLLQPLKGQISVNDFLTMLINEKLFDTEKPDSQKRSFERILQQFSDKMGLSESDLFLP